MASKKVVGPKAKIMQVKHPLQIALHVEEMKRGRFLTTAEIMKVYTKTLPKLRSDLAGLKGATKAAIKAKIKGSKTTEGEAAPMPVLVETPFDTVSKTDSNDNSGG
jgi:hypothetical protein